MNINVDNSDDGYLGIIVFLYRLVSSQYLLRIDFVKSIGI